MKKILDNKIFKFVYGIVKFLVILIIVLYVGMLAFQRFSNNSSIGGYRIFRVASSSMKPIYNINDVLLVKDIDDYNILKVGDDVTYQGTRGEMSGKIVTHRIIKIDNSKGVMNITTKGVANELEDPSISPEQIYGRVEMELTPISFINGIFSTKIGFFFLIFLPFVTIVFLEILDTIRDKDNEK